MPSSFLNERTAPSQCLLDALDNQAEQPLQLFSRRCVFSAEFRYAVLHAINSIGHQAMQMDVKIGRRTETLYQSDRTDLCITPLESSRFDQKSGNDAQKDLQY